MAVFAFIVFALILLMLLDPYTRESSEIILQKLTYSSSLVEVLMGINNENIQIYLRLLLFWKSPLLQTSLTSSSAVDLKSRVN